LAASLPATLGFCLDAAEQRSNDSSPGKNIAVGLVFQQNQNCVKGLFQELQSKWIYRVTGGYIVSAWVILQVAAIVFPSLELPSWTMKVVLDVLLLGFVPALLLGWHLDLRRARAERSSALNKDAAGGPQSPSEHTLLGEGRAGLDAKRQAMQTAPRGETPEKISVSRLPITGSDVFGREEDLAILDRAWANQHINVVGILLKNNF
jgi:hypothetical protein